MHVYDVRIAQVLVAPYAIEDNITGEYLAWVGEEKLQYIELTDGKLDGNPFAVNSARLPVHNDITHPQYLLQIDALSPQDGTCSSH